MPAASRFLRYIPESLMRGPDVLDVQYRLRAQGFYQGPVDSIYGRVTYDAVIAFQAVRDLIPDGIVGPNTYMALGSSSVPLALGDKGPSITIDTEQRKLFFNVGGALRRSYDVAVGAPGTPSPIGLWVVVQKIMNPGGPFGTRWMRLNVPWGGYGIHGTDTPESIGQAVSHGCIRMHNEQVEELYPEVPLGTTVSVTGQIFTGRVLTPMSAPGADIRAVQELLSALGYFQGEPTGVYDTATMDAVRRFQAEYGLVPDGIVGTRTYNALLGAFDIERGNIQP